MVRLVWPVVAFVACDATNQPTLPAAAGQHGPLVDVDEITGPAQPVTIEFLGDGLGEVYVYDRSADTIVICRSSCTVPGGNLELTVSTPVDFNGFSACNADYGPWCPLPAGTTFVTVSFMRRPGEVDFPGASDADFDSANNLMLVVGGSVAVFDSVLQPKWSAPGVRARFTPIGNLFVQDATHHVVKYDATGTVIASGMSPRELAATTPSDGALLADVTGFDIMNASANVIATPTYTKPWAGCIAASGDGTITAGVQGFWTFVDMYQADGSFLEESERDSAIQCTLRNDWHGGLVFTESEFDEISVTDGNVTFDYSYVESGPTAGGADAAGNVTWAYAVDHQSDPFGIKVVRLDQPQHDAWSMIRPPQYCSACISVNDVGLSLTNLVVAPDGRVAISALWYHTDRSVTPIVEIFVPVNGPSAH